MNFKNIRAYAVHPSFELPDGVLSLAAFTPCQPTQRASAGFTPLDTDRYESDGLALFRTQERIVPKDVLTREVNRRSAALERKVTKRERQALTEDLLTELLPKAFVKTTDVWCYFHDEYFIVLDSSAARAEHIGAVIRSVTGSFPIRPFGVGYDCSDIMTRWFTDDVWPHGTEPLNSCHVSGDGEKIRFDNVDLPTEQLMQCLAADKTVERLDVHITHTARFTLLSDWSIRRFEFIRYHETFKDMRAVVHAVLTLLRGEWEKC